jgi:hypothetical protein
MDAVFSGVAGISGICSFNALTCEPESMKYCVILPHIARRDCPDLSQFRDRKSTIRDAQSAKFGNQANLIPYFQYDISNA